MGFAVGDRVLVKSKDGVSTFSGEILAYIGKDMYAVELTNHPSPDPTEWWKAHESRSLGEGEPEHGG